MMLLFRLFWVFAKVGLLAYGGGPSMIPLMQQEVVNANWLSPQDFVDALALGNALPGPIATKMSLYVGYKQAGLPGALCGLLGTIGPSGVLMLILAAFFLQLKDSPAIKAALVAVRPTVVGLLMWTAYDLGSKVLRNSGVSWGTAALANWDKFLIALLVFVAVTYFTGIKAGNGLLNFVKSAAPALAILVAAVFGIMVYR
jgi:chromate transporter